MVVPYKSKAQQRLFHAKAATGEISQAEVHKWDEATKRVPGGFKGLPLSVRSLQHVASKGRR
jgi:hypothetical protein